MTNKEIAREFNLLGKIMELHDENQFKVRSYANAYINIRKFPEPLAEMEPEKLSDLPGIGKAISEKIKELLSTGEMETLNRYLAVTPPGIVEMLQIKGFGPKKIKLVWKELGIESVGELMYAVNENRLLDLKGFGQKTQDNLKEQLEYFIASAGQKHLAAVLPAAAEIFRDIKTKFPGDLHSLTGEVYRKEDTVSGIEILTTTAQDSILAYLKTVDDIAVEDEGIYYYGFPLIIQSVAGSDFYYELAVGSSTEKFAQKLDIPKKNYNNEEEVFINNQLPYYIPEFRQDENVDALDSYPSDPSMIIASEHLKGCIHNHSIWSDGMNTMAEMAEAAKQKGYEYFVMSDHSRSAFYANGLQIERLYMQLDELTALDQADQDIKLFSGIESDILNNGDLDYPDDVLAQLDVVIASVHSNLKMDEGKATQRLITAIENPYTSILGHPTGRLLLSRPAYPIDHKKVIEACAANNVAIELNANPYRLDLDWRWIHYATERGVLISINPDAHSTSGIDDTQFGVYAARKAALSRYQCLNAMELDEFEEWLEEQHMKRG